MAKISVIGTTSWGTTLAILLARSGAQVLLWSRTEEEAVVLESARENQRLLPGFSFPPNMHVTASIQETTAGADVVVLVTPSSTLRENARRLFPHLESHSIVLSATKGLEKTSAKRMSQVLEDELPKACHWGISVLSGPNLAKEIAREMPASTVVASRDHGVALRVQELFMSSTFRVYTNTDVVGVELGGALKNIVALGAGISDGLGYGDNGKAAFITRGLFEITRLGIASGAKALTFAGLTGLGDLVATCFSPLSRNRYVGEELATGKSLAEILSSMTHFAEGIDTTLGALNLARSLDIDMPLTQAISEILFEGMDPRQAVTDLMARAPRPEWSGIQI